jgi:glycosyltransferase involved in cell wall biosynthesis
LITAFERGSNEVVVASRLRSFSNSPDPTRLLAFEQTAQAEIERLAVLWRDRSKRPDLFLTYHVYYKAPDLIGPTLARHLAVPYVTLEASHATKRNHDLWRDWQRRAEQALRVADLHLCLTRNDREGLAKFLGSEQRLADLPPFIDVGLFAGESERPSSGPVELIAVAMMRPGVKLESYRFLAESLKHLTADWRLTIIGSGEAQAEVQAAFAGFPVERLRYRGVLAPESVGPALRQADIYVWPGFNEAFGVAYIEAGAAGLPVVALDSGGVSTIVQHERNGLLVETADPQIYAQAIGRLINDPHERHRLGKSARQLAHDVHGLETASLRLCTLLRPLVDAARTPGEQG